MKIAYFTESFLPNTDGVSHTFGRLIETLLKNQIDFRFFSPFKPDTDDAWNEKVRKITSFTFPLYKKYKLALPIFDNPREELDQFKPDLIHVTAPTPLSRFGIKYAEKNNIPVVASYHTHFVSYFSYYGFQSMESLGWGILRWFHNQCAMNYAPSKSAAALLREQGIKNVGLWERGIDVEMYSPKYRSEALRRELGAEKVPILLFVGRLVKEKDLDDLIAADQILRADGYSYKLVAVGDGPMREELKEKIPDIHLPGYLLGRELSEMYASADIFVFPSTTETFGNVIQEAFASGTPVVAVKAGGPGDLVISGHNGLLAKANEPQDFADKCKLLLRNDRFRKYLGNYARRDMLEKTWEKNNLRLIESYREVIHNFYNNSHNNNNGSHLRRDLSGEFTR